MRISHGLKPSGEVDTLERAFHSLIELGDQQMADLYCIQELVLDGQWMLMINDYVVDVRWLMKG